MKNAAEWAAFWKIVWYGSDLEFELEVFDDAIDRCFESFWSVVLSRVDLLADSCDQFAALCWSCLEIREVTSDIRELDLIFGSGRSLSRIVVCHIWTLDLS